MINQFDKKKLGIVGGMGPMATVELFNLIVRHTASDKDQGHIRIFIDNNPQIPDRTRAILDGSNAPIKEIVNSANNLVGLGADYILIPCNTSHYFYDDIQAKVNVEIINMIDETAKTAKRLGYERVGLLATEGTIKGRIYQKYFEKHGIQIVVPLEEEQTEVMKFIYSGVKASNYDFDTTSFLSTINSLERRGAQTMVLGCTEIPVGIKMYNLSFGHIDSLDTLARTAVLKAGYELQ